MSLEEVECGLCGLSLGIGVPGGKRWCSECGHYVVAQVERGHGRAAAGAVAAVGVGLVAAYVLSRLLGGRR